MTEQKIITSMDYVFFARQVNTELKDGWRLMFPVSVAVSSTEDGRGNGPRIQQLLSACLERPVTPAEPKPKEEG